MLDATDAAAVELAALAGDAVLVAVVAAADEVAADEDGALVVAALVVAVTVAVEPQACSSGTAASSVSPLSRIKPRRVAELGMVLFT